MKPFERLWSRAEEWIYELNERDHWLFRVYDYANELWARLAFRGVRRRAESIDTRLEGLRGITVRMRMLRPADVDAFAGLLEEVAKAKYVPPHPLDREGARRALARFSYLPFGMFDGERLIGYQLVRLLFPWRAATGAWYPEGYQNARLGQIGGRTTAAFTRAENLADYITVPLDNPASLRTARGAGWEVVRKNRRFYVLLRR